MDPQSMHQPGLDLPQPTLSASNNILATSQSGSMAVPNQKTPNEPTGLPKSSTGPARNADQLNYGTDAVDREWIDRAEEIIERAHADPYLASKELSRLKAQYVKARYNKEIKTVDD